MLEVCVMGLGLFNSVYTGTRHFPAHFIDHACCKADWDWNLNFPKEQ